MTGLLVGEGAGSHMHSYEESVTGAWQWCDICKCMVTNPCGHGTGEMYQCCWDRAEYIRLRTRYEPAADAPTARSPRNGATSEAKSGGGVGAG
jgi:hypothetical protein